MKRALPLRILIPAGIFAIFFSILFISITNSVQERKLHLIDELRNNAQLSITQLTRHAGHFLRVAPEVLHEDIIQVANDKRIKEIALLDAEYKVLFANNPAWHKQNIINLQRNVDTPLLKQAIHSNSVITHLTADQTQMLVIMRYDSEPNANDAKGLIYVNYTLTHLNDAAWSKTIPEHIPEFALIILGALSLTWMLHILITLPMEELRVAATKISKGDFTELENEYGAQEIRTLRSTFNSMSAQLAQQVEKLNEQVIHTQSILDHLVDGVITINDKGIIDSFNPAASKIFGYQRNEVMGKNINMLMPSPDREKHDSYLKNYHSTGIAKIIGIGREVTGLRKNGATFPMDLAITEVRQQGQRMYIGLVRDISERKQIERMKSEFVSTVSHELRTPLTSISGALGLINNGVLGTIPPQAQQMLNIAYKNAQRLIFLINDLLDMEKLVAGKMVFDLKPHVLRTLIEQALEINRTYGSERNIALTFNALNENIEVLVDQQRLMQVMSNLLSNAIKYSPENGFVEIDMCVVDKNVRVSVTDHGLGIPIQFHERIFQKFTQADSSDARQKGGTGLGLAITKELVERMGGTINFHSVEGQGATFYFDLPINAESSAGAISIIKQAVKHKKHEQRLNLLHIENDADLHEIIKTILRDEFECTLATTLATARFRLEQNQYQLIILDLGLPDGSGWELLPLIQAKQAEAKVIILSGSEYAIEDLHRVQATLLKSRLTPQELLDTIHNQCQL